MPVFPKPKFAFDYSVDEEVAHLRAWKAKPDRQIPVRQANRLLVATWNIANLGAQDRRPADLRLIAEIAGWFDLVAIQECRDNFAHLEDIVRNLASGYRYLMSDASGNNERMVFVYDSRKLTLLEKVGEIAFAPSALKRITIKGIRRRFEGCDRSPYLAAFKAGHTSFLFVNVHLFYGSDAKADVERRALETMSVARWADDRRRSAFSFTREMVVLGDFNMPKAAKGDRIYDALTKLGLHTAAHATRVGSTLKSDRQYDQVSYFPAETGDLLTGKTGVFDFDGAVFPLLWQQRPEKDFKAYLRYYLSDHRPLWVELEMT